MELRVGTQLYEALPLPRGGIFKLIEPSAVVAHGLVAYPPPPSGACGCGIICVFVQSPRLFVGSWNQKLKTFLLWFVLKGFTWQRDAGNLYKVSTCCLC